MTETHATQHPPRRWTSGAQVHARHVVDVQGLKSTKVEAYCPHCDQWSPVIGGERVRRSLSALAELSALGRHDDASTTALEMIMQRRVVCVRPELPIDDVVALLLQHDLGGVPVIDAADRLVGIITMSDLVRAEAAATRGDERTRVQAVMTPFVFSLHPEASISRAAALMAYEGIHHIAVVAPGGALIGIVTATDVMRFLAQRAGYVVTDHRAGGATTDLVAPPATGSVLVVDDDADLLAGVRDALADEGYDVITATNGAEAIAHLRAATPSLIMLDLAMPVMDGWSLFATLARDPATSRIPVVLLSGRTDLPGEVARLGAAGYLTKPVPLRRLLTTVEQYCKA